MSTDGLHLAQEKVSKAVAAVLTSTGNKKKNDVLDDDVDNFQMQICLKKIPAKSKTSKLNLPHSILRPDLDVCIFVKDLDKKEREYEPTVEHFQELFSKKGVSSFVAEIIPLKSLRLEYQPFEAKRNLSNSYDIFLADERIFKFLPRLLGKHFYNGKKNPEQVNLRAQDLKKEINGAINRCKCIISDKGSSSMVTIGHTGMIQKDLTANIMALGKQLSACVPGGFNNIKQLLLKTKSSFSVPVYLSSGGPQDVQLQKEPDSDDGIEAEEISTVMDGKVKVYPDGRILIIKDGETEEQALKRVKMKSKGQKLRERKTPLKGKRSVKRLKKTKAKSVKVKK